MTAATPWIGSSTDHYENFPVASWLLPRFSRAPIAAVYAFARYADDVADEGEVADSLRLAELAALRRAVVSSCRLKEPHSAVEPELDGNRASHRLVTPMARPVAQYQIQPQWLLDLLSAFEQDVRSKRHPDRASLMNYCSRSADPIGKIVLQVFGRLNATTQVHSNAICSALQLINFLQDFKKDWQVGRLYVPQDEMKSAGLSEAQIERAVSSGRACGPLRAVIQTQANLAGELLISGTPLLGHVPWRLRLELAAIIAGGQRVLHKLAEREFDPIANRPKLSKADVLGIAWQMLVQSCR